MAKETKQQIIDRMTAEIQELRNECDMYYNKILELQEKSDQEFANSSYCKQLLDENERLKTRVETLERQNQKGIHKIKNERGAGRKPKMTAAEKEQIVLMRESGMSIKKISEHMECSVGLVHKIIHE